MGAQGGIQALFDYPIGWILRPHGLRGELVAKLFRARRSGVLGRRRHAVELVTAHTRDSSAHHDSSAHDDGSESGRSRRVLRLVRFTDPSTAVLQLEGIDDRTAAEALVGAKLYVDPSDAPSCLLDEADGLYGALAIHAESGASLGRVSGILDNGAQPVLALGDEDDPILIPYVDAFVASVERTPEVTRVMLRPIDGLLSLESDEPSAH
ncbi:MAG: hypothetical protein IPK13_23265 [Deltaproteobacteria bacterium]|nr:hypothetical protein [Deltaproteobacteria bacterium]